MKKWYVILILLLTVTFTGCSKLTIKFGDDENIQLKDDNKDKTSKEQKLSSVEYPDDSYEPLEVSDEFIVAYNNFTKKVVKEIFVEKNNQFFSPISLYFAIAMLAEGISDEDALEEVEALLGLSIDIAREELKKIYQNNYYDTEFGRAYLANSIWYDYKLDINSEYTKLLQTSYYAESYKINFANADDKKKIVDWINYYTENLLNLTPENYPIPDDIVLMLINTIYYNSKFSESYFELKSGDNAFYQTKTDTVEATYMRKIFNTSCQITDDYTLVRDTLEPGSTITFVTVENKLADVLNMDYEKLVNPLGTGKITVGSRIDLTIPKFETFTEYQLTDTLKTLGVNKVFNASSNALENIAKNLYIEKVGQNTGIKVDEYGIEAAAVTSIMCGTTSVQPMPRVIKLDKPFVYFITDATGIILFVGYLYNPA